MVTPNDITIEADNPRGYAFVAFSRAYEVTLSWDWAAALKHINLFPTKWDWIEVCLKMYDSIMLDATDHEAVTQFVLKQYRKSLYQDVKGGFTRAKDEDGNQFLVRRYVSIDPGSVKDAEGGSTDGGINDITNAAEMRTRMVRLRKVLTDKEFEALSRYVLDGSYSFKETVISDLGWTKQEYDSVRRSIRYKCKGMEFA